MILTVDSSALALLVNPSGEPPTDPSGAPVPHARERIEHLLASLNATDTIIVPTPVLAEMLVVADEGAPAVLEQLTGQARLRIEAFDMRAAVETAMMTRAAKAAGDKRGGSSSPYQKVKVDRQIVAIARVHRSTRLYADDRNLVTFARALDMDVVSTWELPLPEVEETLFSAAGLGANGQLPGAEPAGEDRDKPF